MIRKRSSLSSKSKPFKNYHFFSFFFLLLFSRWRGSSTSGVITEFKAKKIIRNSLQVVYILLTGRHCQFRFTLVQNSLLKKTVTTKSKKQAIINLYNSFSLIFSAGKINIVKAWETWEAGKTINIFTIRSKNQEQVKKNLRPIFAPFCLQRK